MNLESLRAHCLGKPGATEDTPFGDDVLVFRVRRKIFALTNLDGPPFYVNLKCDPEQALEWRAEYDGVRPGYHMNKKHWNSVDLDGAVPAPAVREMVDHSYDQTVRSLTRAERQALAEGR